MVLVFFPSFSSSRPSSSTRPLVSIQIGNVVSHEVGIAALILLHVVLFALFKPSQRHARLVSAGVTLQHSACLPGFAALPQQVHGDGIIQFCYYYFSGYYSTLSQIRPSL